MSLDTLIRLALVEYLGWTYATTSPPKVAIAAPGVPPAVVWKPGNKKATNCTVFLAGVLTAALRHARWPADAWARLQIMDRAAPWSVLDVLIAAGIARYADAPSDGRWYAFQGWSGLVNGRIVDTSRGHCGFLYGRDRVVEATTYTDQDGDGKSTDPGAVAWRVRSWDATRARWDNVRIVELLPPPV